MDSMLVRRSSLMIFIRQKEPRVCACQGYRYEKEPASFADEPFLSRKARNNAEICFYGKLAIDVFTCEKFLLPNVKIRLRLVRS